MLGLLVVAGVASPCSPAMPARCCSRPSTGVARANGVPVAALDVGFLLVLALAVAATSQITGALLVFALLVAPPAAAQQLITVARWPGSLLGCCSP